MFCEFDLKTKEGRNELELAYLLSLLFPVSLSTTVDFSIWGSAILIRYSHSSFDCQERMERFQQTDIVPKEFGNSEG